MSDELIIKQTMIGRFVSTVMRAFGKVEKTPVVVNHGASWENPYGIKPGYSADQAMSAFGGHGYSHACVSRASADLAALPLKLITGTGKDQQVVSDSPVLDIFKNPSTGMDGLLFREQVCTDLMLDANCFVLLLGLSDQPDSVVRLHPGEVEIITDPKIGITGYRHDSSGSVVIYEPERIIHIRGASYQKGPRENYGTSPIQALARSITADINSQQLASEASAKGRPDILLYPKDPADIWSKEQRREILSQYRGLASIGGALCLSGQAEVRELKLTPREMEFQASREMARQEISAVFGIGPAVLGLPSANFATLKQQTLNYWQNQKNRARKIDQLFTEIARRFNPDYSVIHDFSGVAALQELRDSQLDRVGKLIAYGVSPAEAFEFEGLGEINIKKSAAADSEPNPEDVDAEKQEAIEAGYRSLAKLVAKTIQKDPVVEEQRSMMWSEWMERAYKPTVQKFYREANTYLRGASLRYAKRAEQYISQTRSINGSMFRAVEDWSELLGVDVERAILNDTLGDIFSKVWSLQGSGELKKVFKLAGMTMPDNLVFGSREIEKMLIAKMIKQITRTTADHVQDIVEDGLIDGLSVDEIAEQLESSLAFGAGRARLIARTEATISVNGATNEAYKQAFREGIPVRKEWLTARDDKVRPSKDSDDNPIFNHRILDGVDVLPDANFVSGEWEAPAPGQFQEAGMSCNCRCTLIPKIVR